MGSLIRSISSVMGAALLISVLVSPALAALPAQAAELSNREVTTHHTIEGRRAVSIDTAASTGGDLTFTSGSVALTEGGEFVGTFTTKANIVIPDTGGRERRGTTVEVSLPTGALFAQQIQDDPTGLPPDKVSDMVVVGGTGPLRNAPGVVTVGPNGARGLKLVRKLASNVGIDRERATALAFERLVDVDVPGHTAPAGQGRPVHVRRHPSSDYVRRHRPRRHGRLRRRAGRSHHRLHL